MRKQEAREAGGWRSAWWSARRRKGDHSSSLKDIGDSRRRLRFIVAIGFTGGVLAAAFTIATLLREADACRQAQILLARFESTVNLLSALEWQAVSREEVAASYVAEVRERVEEAKLVLAQLEAHQGKRRDLADSRKGIVTGFARYESAVREEIGLLRAGRKSDAVTLDETVVDPSYESLMMGIRYLDSVQESVAVRDAHMARDGSIAVLLLSLTAMWVLGGRLDTNRRRLAVALATQRATASAEERYRCLLENASDMTLVLAPDGRCSYASPSATAILGRSKSGVVTGRLTGLLHPDDRERARADAKRALSLEDGFVSGEFRVVLGSDERVVEVTTRNRIRDPGIGGIVLNVRDITEQKRVGEQSQQAQKLQAIGLLAGGVAHDFNNILTVILGYGEAVAKRLGPDHPQAGMLQEIVEAGKRAASLTRQLLAFSRHQVLEPRVMDLNIPVRNVEKMLRRLIGENVELIVDLAENLRPVLVDPSQIEQILMNLAVNGRDAMPDGGTLVIETRDVDADGFRTMGPVGASPGAYVLISVRDTGRGMDERTKAHIFEPFFTTKGMDKGTGLGLSTVYGIVKQSEGYITVRSEPGQGATFRIYLPAASSKQTARPIQTPRVPLQACRKTVLLVEDQPEVQSVVTDMLEGAGYEVLGAETAEDAMEISRGVMGPIDLLLTDIVLPGMGGRELSEQMAQLRPGMKCLLMSGYTEDVRTRQEVMGAVTAFIHKPFTIEQLQIAIAHVLVGQEAAA